MSELVSSAFFGVTLTVIAYWIGMTVQNKTGLVICNHMVIAAGLIVLVLKCCGISYEEYYVGGSIVNMLLGPATACMALTIYQKWELLKENWLPVLLGCLAGSVTTVVTVLVLCRLFGLSPEMTVSLLPKSVSTPIASAISESHGGIVSITVAAVIFTGILGNLTGPYLIKLFRVKDPMAAGLGLGACAHGMGTAKALEIGRTEGAMGGLAIGICGIITSLLALGFGFLV